MRSALLAATLFILAFLSGVLLSARREAKDIICSMDIESNLDVVREGSYDVTHAVCDRGEKVVLIWHD